MVGGSRCGRHTGHLVFSEIADTVTNIGQLGASTVVEAAVRLVWTIEPDTRDTITTCTLSHNIATRFQYVQIVADAIKVCARGQSTLRVLIQQLGYSADVGYQTLLYANAIDLRKLFVYLIEKANRVDQHELQPIVASNLSRPVSLRTRIN
jgi:hypothetical protein